MAIIFSGYFEEFYAGQVFTQATRTTLQFKLHSRSRVQLF